MWHSQRNKIDPAGNSQHATDQNMHSFTDFFCTLYDFVPSDMRHSVQWGVGVGFACAMHRYRVSRSLWAFVFRGIPCGFIAGSVAKSSQVLRHFRDHKQQGRTFEESAKLMTTPFDGKYPVLRNPNQYENNTYDARRSPFPEDYETDEDEPGDESKAS